MTAPTSKPERELKILLSKAQYEELLSIYNFEPPIKQVNTYYDTPDQELKRKSSALRIRNVEGKNFLTAKQPLDNITKSELEYQVSDKDLHNLKKEELSPITSLVKNPDTLLPIATFTTYRSYLKTDMGEFCLDKNLFSNFTDYELEYEYKKDHDGVQVLNAFLEPLGITYKKNGPSKVARATSTPE